MATYTIWYMKPRWFRDAMIGKPPYLDINHTHIKLKDMEVDNPKGFAKCFGTDADLEWIFFHQQGENWSPNGEARDLIEAKGLQHTSMSVGDVIQQGNDFWVVARFGFDKLEGVSEHETV